jgi:hypothetical protein
MEAWYDGDAKSVTCVDCQHRVETASRPCADPPPWPPPLAPDPSAGRAWRDAQATRSWGRLAPPVEFVTEEHRRTSKQWPPTSPIPKGLSHRDRLGDGQTGTTSPGKCAE